MMQLTSLFCILKLEKDLRKDLTLFLKETKNSPRLIYENLWKNKNLQS